MNTIFCLTTLSHLLEHERIVAHLRNRGNTVMRGYGKHNLESSLQEEAYRLRLFSITQRSRPFL